jgi:hypothetical protein
MLMLHKITPTKPRSGRFFTTRWQIFLVFGICLILCSSICPAAGELNKNRYIPFDEVKAGMKGYCLTIYKGTVPEKFEIEVIDVLRNIMPGRNVILVQSTDERFIHTGPVAGCSGSPVYINGKLAGALALGWIFSKDPLYGVTPIEEMLKVGHSDIYKTGENPLAAGGFVFDFSKPLNFDLIYKQMTAASVAKRNMAAGAVALPIPVVGSALPDEVGEELDSSLEPLGFMAVTGLSAAPESNAPSNAKLVPGACLAIPFVSGDIKLTAIGTVTEVDGDKVYAFGHNLLGYGKINLPMATGQIHTVVASLLRSFKIGTAVNTIGALTIDESTAVFGRIGEKAQTIPLTINVDRYNDTQKRTYNCQMAVNQILTPMILPVAVNGAALMMGNLPPEHMIEYDVDIRAKNAETISFRNVSTSLGLMELAKESGGTVALLMNNPYEKVDIDSINLNIRISPKNIISHIWSVDLAGTKVKAGEQITADIVVESYLGGKKKYQVSMPVPQDLPPGTYDFTVMGGYAYREFLVKTEPYRFIAQNMPNLISAINDFLNIRKDKLYCVLLLPPGGLAVEKAELPDLPATKALVLADPKRTLKTQPYPNWIQKEIDTDTVTIDSKTLQITVEKQDN